MKPVALIFAVLLGAGTVRAQPLPAAPASGAKSVQGGSVDRFADAVLFAAAAREAESFARVRTLTLDLDDGVVFWRASLPAGSTPEASGGTEPGAWPGIDCRALGPDIDFHSDVFCANILSFFQSDGEDSGDASGGMAPYEITYHERTWAGRKAHGFTIASASGGSLTEDMDSYEMWIDGETLALVLMRTTGSEAPGAEPFTFSFERSDLRQIKGLTVPHHYRYTLYGAAPMFLESFTPEEHEALEQVRLALDAPDVETAIEALPEDIRDAVGFYDAILGNGPLEVEYAVRGVHVNRPLPAGVFGGFGR